MIYNLYTDWNATTMCFIKAYR